MWITNNTFFHIKMYFSISIRKYKLFCFEFTELLSKEFIFKKTRNGNIKLRDIKGPTIDKEGNFTFIAILDLSRFNYILTTNLLVGLIYLLYTYYLIDIFLKYRFNISKASFYELFIYIDLSPNIIYSSLHNKDIILGNCGYKLSFPVDYYFFIKYINAVMIDYYKFLNKNYNKKKYKIWLEVKCSNIRK